MWDETPDDWIAAFRRAGRRRGYLVTDPANGALSARPRFLEPLAASLPERAATDFDRHQACFFEVGDQSGHLLGAFIHRTHRGQAAGGLRFWTYPTVGAFLRDGLRLSRAMGQKNALAGLWWGGGKGVIARRPGVDHRDLSVRERVYRDYGRFITGLAGCYVTAEDVGTTPGDMARVFAESRFTTCIPPLCGGSGNPSELTAAGVVVAMEAALAHLGRGSLSGKTVAVQGLGNVARFVIRDLFDRGVEKIVGCDVDPETVERAQRTLDSRLAARVAAPDDLSILAEPCDVLSPCAVGGVLNPRTLPTLRCAVVCGAANNQLEETRRDGRDLVERGILYVPDFLANRMGIVNCANEQYGVFPDDPAVHAHLTREAPHGIYRRSLEIFERAAASGRSTAEEAERLADELARESHPIWPGRGQQIVDHLVASDWVEG